MTTNNGVPAFPESYGDPRNQGWIGGGMTLRDYFAANAPFTLIDARGAFHEVEGNYKTPTGQDLMRILVGLRLGYADMMIAERAK